MTREKQKGKNKKSKIIAAVVIIVAALALIGAINGGGDSSLGASEFKISGIGSEVTLTAGESRGGIILSLPDGIEAEDIISTSSSPEVAYFELGNDVGDGGRTINLTLCAVDPGTCELYFRISDGKTESEHITVNVVSGETESVSQSPVVTTDISPETSYETESGVPPEPKPEPFTTAAPVQPVESDVIQPPAVPETYFPAEPEQNAPAPVPDPEPQPDNNAGGGDVPAADAPAQAPDPEPQPNDNAGAGDVPAADAPAQAPDPEPQPNNNAGAGDVPAADAPGEGYGDDNADPGVSRTVYITPTGKRYHLLSSCGGKNSYATTLDQALRRGLTPCKKCANG